jgi:hypothetical protein
LAVIVVALATPEQRHWIAFGGMLVMTVSVVLIFLLG